MKRKTPTHVEIDLQALRFNYRQLKRQVPKGVKTLCVVKSNAYGHGAVLLARVLQREGADFFGVGTVDEGIELREGGIKRPILILLGLVSDEVKSLIRYRLTPVVYDLATAKRLQGDLSRIRRRLPIHLKVDTGMTRLGILPEEVGDFCDRLQQFKWIEPIGLLTHLADAGEEVFTRRQVALFEKARREFQERFPGGRLFHVANSQRVIDKKTGGNIVRLGIALYGAYPLDRDRRLLKLKPVLQWKSRIVSLKEVPPKTPVSYGRTFSTRRKSVIGVVPIGYADGYPRILSNCSQVLVRGKRVRIAGTICMDMMMVDVTSVPGVQVGDEVVLIGRQKGLKGERVEEIRAEEIAALANTISYEIFCRISERVPRITR